MTENTENVSQQQTPVSLELSDLKNLRAVVDMASRRGAFAASEMLAVGTVFSKLDTFVNALETATTEKSVA